MVGRDEGVRPTHATVSPKQQPVAEGAASRRRRRGSLIRWNFLAGEIGWLSASFRRGLFEDIAIVSMMKNRMEDNRNAPATLGHLDDLEARLKERYDILRSEMRHLHHGVVERLGDTETRLLKEFYNFGQSNNKRITEVEGNEAALRSRLATIEDRLLEVERRLDLPPAA